MPKAKKADKPPRKPMRYMCVDCVMPIMNGKEKVGETVYTQRRTRTKLITKYLPPKEK